MGLADTFRSLSDLQLQALFAARPELGEPPPGSFAELAQRASAPYSIQGAVGALDRFSRQLLEALAMVPRGLGVAALSDMESGDTPIPALESGLERLRVLGLAHRNGAGVWSVVPAVARMFVAPGGLGRPVTRLLERHPLASLRVLAGNLALPTPVAHAGMREIREAITAHHMDPVRIRKLLAAAPENAEELLCAIDAAGGRFAAPELAVPRPVVPAALQWLLDHCFVVRVDWDIIEVPAEIGLVLRGGRPFARFEPDRPKLCVVAEPLGLHGLTPLGVLDALTRLGHAWAAEPLRLRKSGGMAVKDVKALAKLLGLGERAAAVFVEIAHEAELIDEDLVRDLVTITHGFDEWLALDPPERWLCVVNAWRRCMVDLSTLGRSDDRGRAVMPLGHHPLVAEAVARRARVTRLLGEQVGNIVSFGSLRAVLDWESPSLWRAFHADADDLLRSVLEEMALLGLLRDDALTTAGRTSLLDTPDEARETAAGQFPAIVTTFLIQPDLTALAPAELAPDVAGSLTRLTQPESRGGASLVRFTEVSLRAAFDRGATAAEILAFLRAHAERGVPQSLSVLVHDVERRHGVLRVAAVQSYLRSDDPALLAQVTRTKKLAKLGLRLVAATVAVSDVAPTELIAALRDAGFAPMAEDASGGVVLSAAEVARADRPRWRRPRFEQRADAVWSATLGIAGSGDAAAIVHRLRRAHDA